MAVPLSSGSVSSVVPVFGGPLFSGSGSASVIEVGDSDSAASDTEIPVFLVSVGSSVVPPSVGPWLSESSSASVIEVGDSILEVSDIGVPVSGDSRSKRTRRGLRRRVVDAATPDGVLLVPVSSVLRDDELLGVPALASSEGSLTRRQRRRLNEKAKKAALLDGLPPVPS